MTPFPPELRTASVVPRWSVVWTLTRDTVSNHSYFVAVYAHQIARLIEWQGDYGHLLFKALTHDLDETITGDIVSPVKRQIIDNKRAAAYIDRQMRKRLPAVMRHIDEMGQTVEIDQIIKAADCLDALLFLTVEQRMGNGVISEQIPRAWDNLSVAWYKLPGSMAIIDNLFNATIIPSVEAHKTKGGYGVE